MIQAVLAAVLVGAILWGGTVAAIWLLDDGGPMEAWQQRRAERRLECRRRREGW